MTRSDMQTSGQADAPQTLVGVSFDSPFRAQEFVLAVSGIAASGPMKLVDAVTLLKDEDGKTVVRETVDPTPVRSAFSGAMWAGLFGLVLGGPVGWVTGLAVGAGAGAVSAKAIDLGVPDEWVQWFREAVRPGTVTVALLVEHLDRNALVREASRFVGAELVYANVDDVTINRLREAFASDADRSRDASTVHPAHDVNDDRSA